MALLSKKEIAELFGVPTNQISVYIKRALDKGAINLTGELLDDAKPDNKFWLDKYISKKKVKDPAVQKADQAKVKTEKLKPDDSTEPNPKATSKKEKTKPATNNYHQLEAEKSAAQKEKIELESEKLRITIRKLRGEVLPTDVIKPLILQQNQSILSESKNTIADIIRIIGKKKSLTATEKAEITTQYISALNEMIKKATAITVKSLNSIINEYSERRGIGERT